MDHFLSALLLVQGLTMFVAVPLNAAGHAGRLTLDACHLAFAAICIVALTRHPAVRAFLVLAIAAIVGWPMVGGLLRADFNLDANQQHDVIGFIAFALNACVTAVVARHVFANGRITGHRVRGAILIYLNIAALFAIAYATIEAHDPNAFQVQGLTAGTRAAPSLFTYFSLTTITTTGFGDITPMHPITRSLATLEAVIGQLFPATLLARLVALHLAHDGALSDGS